MNFRFFILAAVFLCGNAAVASQDQAYGLGGTTTGKVGAVTADVENGFAALYNPALLSAQSTPQLSFATSVTSSHFSSLGNVLVDSEKYRTQEGLNRTDNFNVPPAQSVLWALGFTYPFPLPKWSGKRKAGVGITLSGPFNKLRSFNSSTAYDFYTLRYGKSDTQFKGTFGFAVEAWKERLYVGAGLSLFITGAGSAEATIVSENPTGRWNHDVGLNTAVIVGLYGKMGIARTGLVYRQAIQPTFNYDFVGQAQIMKGAKTLDQPFSLNTSLYYEPELIEFDWQQPLGRFTLTGGVSYQLWSAYQAPFLVVRAADAEGNVRTSESAQTRFSNTLSPRIAIDSPLWSPAWNFSAGYQFRPTPLSEETVRGATNILDSDTHVVGASLRQNVRNFAGLPPFTWGAFAQFHLISQRAISKTDPQAIGSPGYNFSGNTSVYGISLQAEL